MALITLEDAKDKFEVWEDYCTIEGSAKTPDQILQEKIDDAEIELTEYLDVDETTVTDREIRHLVNIIRYNCFRVKHGDTDFDNKPQIVVDYENTIERLKEWQGGDALGQSQDLPTMDAKTRRFAEGGWFKDNLDC